MWSTWFSWPTCVPGSFYCQLREKYNIQGAHQSLFIDCTEAKESFPAKAGA